MPDLHRSVGVRLSHRGTVRRTDRCRNLKAGTIGIQRAEHHDRLIALQHHVRGENRSDVQHSGCGTVFRRLSRGHHVGTGCGTSRCNHSFSSYRIVLCTNRRRKLIKNPAINHLASFLPTRRYLLSSPRSDRVHATESYAAQRYAVPPASASIGIGLGCHAKRRPLRVGVVAFHRLPVSRFQSADPRMLTAPENGRSCR